MGYLLLSLEDYLGWKQGEPKNGGRKGEAGNYLCITIPEGNSGSGGDAGCECDRADGATHH